MCWLVDLVDYASLLIVGHSDQLVARADQLTSVAGRHNETVHSFNCDTFAIARLLEQLMDFPPLISTNLREPSSGDHAGPSPNSALTGQTSRGSDMNSLPLYFYLYEYIGLSGNVIGGILPTLKTNGQFRNGYQQGQIHRLVQHAAEERVEKNCKGWRTSVVQSGNVSATRRLWVNI